MIIKLLCEQLEFEASVKLIAGKGELFEIDA